MELLDTDVLIDVQRGHPPALAWFSGLGWPARSRSVAARRGRFAGRSTPAGGESPIAASPRGRPRTIQPAPASASSGRASAGLNVSARTDAPSSLLPRSSGVEGRRGAGDNHRLLKTLQRFVRRRALDFCKGSRCPLISGSCLANRFWPSISAARGPVGNAMGGCDWLKVSGRGSQAPHAPHPRPVSPEYRGEGS